MKLILATHNKHKQEELAHLLSDFHVQVRTLGDYPNYPEIKEDGKTFLENAQKKARAIAIFLHEWTLADDTGLVVDALGGRPGIYSARYAGKAGDYAANNKKLLKELKDVSNEKRQASFVCSVVLMAPDGREWDVEGHCSGVILDELRGKNGFGYDPLFFIPQLGKTMAELTMSEKGAISHRGHALRKIKDILSGILTSEK